MPSIIFTENNTKQENTHVFILRMLMFPNKDGIIFTFARKWRQNENVLTITIKYFL